MDRDTAKKELHQALDAWFDKWNPPGETGNSPHPPNTGSGPAAPQKPTLRPGPHSYKLEVVEADDRLPRAVTCMGRLTHGFHDKLILGFNYREWTDGENPIYQFDKNVGRPQPFNAVRGPHHGYEIIADIFTQGPKIYVVPESMGQGCKLDVLTVNEHSEIIGHHQRSFEFSHADHDEIDWGAGGICPRTGRMILGYGNTQRKITAGRPDEVGHHMKGLLMEWGRPTPGEWDSWTNQLPGYPRSWVVLDNGHILVACIGQGWTELVEVDSRPWDRGLEPNAGRRAPRKQGYWRTLKRRINAWATIWDPYVEGGEFNDIYFAFSEANRKPWWAYRHNPTDLRPVIVRHQGGVDIPDMPGNFFAGCIHPETKRPVIANGLGFLVFYEAFWEGGRVVMQEVRNAGQLGDPRVGAGGWNLNGIAYKNAAYFCTGNYQRGRGERSPGLMLRLAAR